MARRRYLVCYDIADQYRLRKVHAYVKGQGDPLQYSVFVCDLNPIEKVDLMFRLRQLINEGADRVAIIDLGEVGSTRATPIEFLGRKHRLPQLGPVIV